MREIHKPSHHGSLLFLIVMLILAGGVFAWHFFLNTGHVKFIGEVPFTVDLGDEHIECINIECEAKVPVRTYNATFRKDGYFVAEQVVKVQRWKTQEITAHLKFIPLVKARGTTVLPLENAPLRPPFLDQTKLKNFPRDVSATLFSYDGSRALVTLGRELFFYDVDAAVVTKTGLTTAVFATWLGNDLAYLKNEDTKQVLYFQGMGKDDAVVTFERRFTKPIILGAPQGDFVLVGELASSSDEGTLSDSVGSYYLVSMKDKTRRKIETLPATAKVVGWSLTGLLFEDETLEGVRRVIYLDPHTLEKTYFGTSSAKNVVETSAGRFLFLSTIPQSSNKKVTGISIADAIEEAQKESTETVERRKETIYYITEFIPAKGEEAESYTTLAQITVPSGQVLSKMTSDPKTEQLSFDIGGTTYVLIEKLR